MKVNKPLNSNLLFKTTYWTLIWSLVYGPAWQVYAAENPRSSNDSSEVATSNDTDHSEDDSSTSSDNAVISAGSLLHITSSDDTKLNGDFRVSVDGKVFLPYNVSAQASGQKLKAFKSKLTKTYRPYFKETPRISVTIKQKRYWIRVLGLVKSPGTYLVKQNTTLDEALAMAQVRTEDLPSGFARVGSGSHTRWISMEDYLKGGHAHDIPAWQGGEQILFQLERPENEASAKDVTNEDAADPSARKIQVLGEVKNPGNVSFQRHADAYYYLIQRGGPTRDSDLGEVEILRQVPNTNERKRITLSDIGNIKDIREADVIIIHPDRATKLERALTTVGIVASILSAIALTVVVARNK